MAALNEVHAIADKIEPRLVKALLLSLERLRGSVNINSLALSLANKDVDAVMRVFNETVLRELFIGPGHIVRDAVLTGGRVEAKRARRKS